MRMPTSRTAVLSLLLLIVFSTNAAAALAQPPSTGVLGREPFLPGDSFDQNSPLPRYSYDANSPLPSESSPNSSSEPTPTYSVTPSRRPTPTPTPSESPSPSLTPSPSASATTTPTPTPTPAPTPSPDTSPSAAPSLTPSPTASESGAPFDPEFTPQVEPLREQPATEPHFTLELQAIIGLPVADAHVVVDAAGLLPETLVELEMRSDPISLGSYAVDASGSVRFLAELPDQVPEGTHSIYARARSNPLTPLPESVERIATIVVDANGLVVGVWQDLRTDPSPGSAPAAPKEPVTGRGDTLIIMQQSGTLLYIDERVSTNATAAAIRSASVALTSPATASGATVTVLLLALLGIALDLPFNLISERAKRYYSRVMSGFRSNEGNGIAPRILGVRVDVILFLIAGQIIAQLNAPLELIPPLGQMVQTAAFGAAAIFIISAWYALPNIALHRQRHGDLGDFRAEWPSLIIAIAALVAAQLSGIVPGFLIGLFTVRKFRRVLPETLTARGALFATLSLVALALFAWLLMDFITAQEPDATTPLRVIADGVLGVVLVAGSQGALLSLLDPGESAATTLRRTRLPSWMAAVGASGGLTFALLASGEIDVALFSPPSSLQEYLLLLGFAVVSLAAIAAVHRLTARSRAARLATE